MVSRGGHSANTVSALGKATLDGSLKVAIYVSGVVDTSEKGILGRIRPGRRRDSVTQGLDGNVDVANDLAVLIECLRSGVISSKRIGKGTRGEVVNMNLDLEVRVGLDFLSWMRGLDDSRNHFVNRGDLAHDCMMVSLDLQIMKKKKRDSPYQFRYKSRQSTPDR